MAKTEAKKKAFGRQEGRHVYLKSNVMAQLGEFILQQRNVEQELI
jgi:hypothetical protein